MTSTATLSFKFTNAKRGKQRKLRYAVEEMHWGYIVRSTDGPALSLRLMQIAAMMFGAGFAAAALGLLLITDTLSGGLGFAFRASAGIIFAGLSAFLLWFASRGTEIEFQFDVNQGEVREMVRNKAGRATLLGRYGFDAIGGVFIERAGASAGNAALVVRYLNTAQRLPVAFGTVQDLEPLRDRLGQDLIIKDMLRA